MDNINIQDCANEVERGLPHETERLYQDKIKLQVYHNTYFDSENYYFDRDGRVRRDLPLMSKVVDTLTRNTYRESPTRSIPGHKTATDFLDSVYKQNRMTTLWQASDRYSHAADVFALQVHCTGDPSQPIRTFGWMADSFTVWTDPDDQTKPIAVCTIDRYDHQTRYRLWTTTEVRTYLTKKWSYETSGGRVAYLVNSEPNPYGILPFSFTHYRTPITQFNEGGIGGTLSQMQRHINFRLMENAEHLRHSKPRLFLMGVDPTKTMNRNPRAGEAEIWGGTKIDSRGDVTSPQVHWLVPPMDWSDKEWDDLKYY